jgi:archaellum component FlaG (FlaF/FlaG flagellin family)
MAIISQIELFFSISSLIVASALVIVTYVLGKYTKRYAESADRQVEAIKRQVETLTSPIISADLELTQSSTGGIVAVEVFVKNIGRGEAYNLTFHVDNVNDFAYLVETKVHKFNELNNVKIERLAPEQRKSLIFIPLPAGTNARYEPWINHVIEKPRTLKISYDAITYDNVKKAATPETYLLDFPRISGLISNLENLGFPNIIRPSYYT